MRIVSWRDVPVAENPHRVDARRVHDSEHAQVVHILLEPGQALRRHVTPVDVLFYVLEGVGVVEIGDERQEVGADTLIESPKDVPHCWYNESEGRLRVLVIKTPRPSKATRLL